MLALTILQPYAQLIIAQGLFHIPDDLFTDADLEDVKLWD